MNRTGVHTRLSPLARLALECPFGTSMKGDAIVNGADALYEAFADFSPSQIRTPLLTLAQKGKEIKTAAMAKVMDSLANLPSAETFMRLVGSSPASSESTPDLTPSAS